MTTTDKPIATAPSRYHRFKQDDGKGFGILRLDALGSNQATIVDADLTDESASARLAAYRREECATASDDRPSIADLQMMSVRDKFSDEAAIIDAAPVLLEIAAAALEMEEHTIGTVARRQAAERYYAALGKVRP